MAINENEDKVEQEVQEEQEIQEGQEEQKKPKNKKKIGIIVGTIAVVVVVAGIGLFVWHEQPSFCGAICHTPMDEYLATYSAPLGESTTDKWGNEVEDSSAMMATLHAASEADGGADADCLSCHDAVFSEQVTEGINWLIGNYYDPLNERTTDDLTEPVADKDGESFCLNEDCHDLTRDDLIELTADLGEYNPHLEQHGETECSDCHKGHRASVNACTECHTTAYVPDGWLTVEEEEELLIYTEDESDDTDDSSSSSDDSEEETEDTEEETEEE